LFCIVMLLIALWCNSFHFVICVSCIFSLCCSLNQLTLVLLVAYRGFVALYSILSHNNFRWTFDCSIPRLALDVIGQFWRGMILIINLIVYDSCLLCNKVTNVTMPCLVLCSKVGSLSPHLVLSAPVNSCSLHIILY